MEWLQDIRSIGCPYEPVAVQNLSPASFLEISWDFYGHLIVIGCRYCTPHIYIIGMMILDEATDQIEPININTLLESNMAIQNPPFSTFGSLIFLAINLHVVRIFPN